MIRTTWLPKQSVLFRTYFVPYADIPECWKQFKARLSADGISLSAADAIGILYDDPVRCARVRYDACISVDHSPSGYDGLGVQVLPGISCLSAAHRGDYPLSFYTCIRLMNGWMMNGDHRRPCLPCYELYDEVPFVNGTEDVESEVCVALR